MMLEEIIKCASNNELNKNQVESICQERQQSFVEFANDFAKNIAKNYMENLYEWLFCDNAINTLWGYSCAVIEQPLDGYAFHVYEAFDAAEYRRKDDPLDFDYESRTKKLLLQLTKETQNGSVYWPS